MKRQYQSFGIDADGKVTHAGVTTHHRMSLLVAKRIQRQWEAWREQYLGENPGDYPLRTVKPTVILLVHPVGRPQVQTQFDV